MSKRMQADPNIKIGDTVVTARFISNFNNGKIQVGHEFKVIGINERGYDLDDGNGIVLTESSFDSIKKP